MAKRTQAPTTKAMRPLEYGTSSRSVPDKPELTLALLPDVPLFRVLSFLPLTDLVAVGQASPRLGEFTRAHRSLWRRMGNSRRVVYQDFEQLLHFLQCAPPVDKLEIHGVYYVLRSVAASKLTVTGNALSLKVECAEARVTMVLQVLQMLAPQLKVLTVLQCRVSPEALSASLREAHCLTDLSIELTSDRVYVVHPSAWCWRPEVVLPSLRHVSIGSSHGHLHAPNAGEIRAATSLLQAHSRQLRRVVLLTGWAQAEVLAACPADLDRLSVAVEEGAVVAAHLRNMHGLRELMLDFVRHLPGNELEQFLRSDDPIALGLQRLDLRLGPFTLAGLIKKGLLLNVHALVLKMFNQPRSRDFREVPAAAIHHRLKLLVLLGECCGGLGTGWPFDKQMDSDFHQQLVSELQDLLRRAPAAPAAAVPAMSLHVFLRWSSRCLLQQDLFFRHSLNESTGCSLCAEAVATARSIAKPDAKVADVQHIQVL